METLGLFDKVKIHELEYKGIIIATYKDSCGAVFKVRYFHNGEAKEVYFFEWELEKICTPS